MHPGVNCIFAFVVATRPFPPILTFGAFLVWVATFGRLLLLPEPWWSSHVVLMLGRWAWTPFAVDARGAWATQMGFPFVARRSGICFAFWIRRGCWHAKSTRAI